MSRLLLATRNHYKTCEFAQLLGPQFDVRDLSNHNSRPAIAESGSTFEENAVIKAVAASRDFPDEIIVADDSGLEVDALGGAPGIFSARYAGENASDWENIQKLLRKLNSAGGWSGSKANSLSAARFRCVLAVAKDRALLTTLAGEIRGHIIDSPQGDNGFGYDPIFVPAGLSQTFAQLPTETKNRISHRGRAVAKLREFLRDRA